MSRKLKHIPNRYIQSLLSVDRRMIGLDGELIAGETYNKTSSAVMSREGIPNFTYHVFDAWNLTVPYAERLLWLASALHVVKNWYMKLAPSKVVESADGVLQAFSDLEWLMGGKYDGLILRSPTARYKFGRSTLNEQWLVKFKQFDDAEAEILGVEEMMHNDNPAEKDALGLTKRSSHKENLSPSSFLGALKVRDIQSGIEFSIGTGFTQEQRYFLWKERDALVGRIVSYRYQGGGGYEAPRFPSFRGFRQDV